MFVVVRVRGSVNVRREVKDSLKMLRLGRTNHCIILPENQNFLGMLKAVSNYVTWGEIQKPLLERLILKRGRIGRKRLSLEESKKIVKKIMENNSVKAGINPVFRLSPPRKGYKSTKQYFPKGDLGYRGEKINDLLGRMI